MAEEAALEWLPQESLLFEGARVDSRLSIELAAGARFIGWDLCCLGRRTVYGFRQEVMGPLADDT